MSKPTAELIGHLLKMKDTEAKYRGIAILLSAHVDKRGHFQTTPRSFLFDMLPHASHSTVAGLVSSLVKTGWLENRGAVNGVRGDWYLNIKRLGSKAKGITTELEVHLAATELLAKYPPSTCALIASEVQQRLRS
jgi:hypothetical protein